VLASVRAALRGLLEERVRLELLVLAAAQDDKDRSSSSLLQSSESSSGLGLSRVADPLAASSSSAAADLAAASARLRDLEEQLARREAARAANATSVHVHARMARDLVADSHGAGAHASSSSSSSRLPPQPVSRYSAHVYERPSSSSGSDSR